jgi:hypothetical protein
MTPEHVFPSFSACLRLVCTSNWMFQRQERMLVLTDCGAVLARRRLCKVSCAVTQCCTCLIGQQGAAVSAGRESVLRKHACRSRDFDQTHTPSPTFSTAQQCMRMREWMTVGAMSFVVRVFSPITMTTGSSATARGAVPDVLYCIVLYCFVLHCIAWYCTVLYCIVLHRIVV